MAITQPEKPRAPDRAHERQIRMLERVLAVKAKGGVRSPHFWTIAGIMLAFGYIYYHVLQTYHDIYIILFFYPLMYASIVYRLRGVLFCGLAFLGIVLPQTFLMSHDIYSLVRILLFAIFAFLLGSMGATLLNYVEHELESYRQILFLNRELNKYIDELQKMQDQLVQSEKMNALGELSASVAHEINNPLSGVVVYTKLLNKKLASGSVDKEEMVRTLTKIDEAVGYCARIVRSLLDFARQTKPVLKPVRLSDVIEQAMTLVGHQAYTKGVKVIRQEDPQVPPVMADFGQLQQVVVNVIVNAVQATPNGGTLTVKTSTENGFVKASFTDTGVGIPPENMQRLFTPFFTTKTEVKGVGLGLSVSYGIVQRHGGRIEVDSQPGKGSTFTVILPISPPPTDGSNK